MLPEKIHTPAQVQYKDSFLVMSNAEFSGMSTGHRDLEGGCEKLRRIAPTSSSGPGSPTGHLWALQRVERRITSLLLRNHKRKPMRHCHATPVRDTSIPQGQGNAGDILLWVSSKKKSKIFLPQAKAVEQTVPLSLPALRVMGTV